MALLPTTYDPSQPWIPPPGQDAAIQAAQNGPSRTPQGGGIAGSLAPQVQPGGATNGPSGPAGGWTLPPGADPKDPAVVASFVKYLSTLPGADPTLATDPNYWIGEITKTGGADTNPNSPQGGTNVGYWTTRSQAGAGNGGGGGSTGGANGFQFDPNNLTNNPTLNWMTQQGINAIGANKAAMGTVLGTGVGKDYIDYAQGAASQFEPMAFNQALQGFQTNFNNLGSLVTGGENATNLQNQYTVGGANAHAVGQVNQANAINNGLTAGQNQIQNASLYGMFNPSTPAPGSSYGPTVPPIPGYGPTTTLGHG
jgi:hypothetical protein